MHTTRSHITRRLTTLGLAAALALTACAGDGNGEAEEPEEPGDEMVAGFDACADDPNACNSGERADGGSITWVVVANPGAWATVSPEGGSIYTSQMLHGILPHTGQFLPDGVSYEYNLELLAAEPQLLSEDPFSYQFTLREEAVWDDGTPITADDFIVTWQLATSEAEGYCVGCRSRSSADADRIESIVGSDNGKTVTLTLKEGERDPEWFGFGGPHDIASGILPAHIAAENDFDLSVPEQMGAYFEYLNNTMPTWSGGPYRLVEGDFENQVIKEPNENWYGEIDPTLDTLIVRFLTDQDSWIPALANDEVHGASPIQVNEDIVTQLNGMDNVYVDLRPGPSWEHIDFNLDVPAFADVELRRAIFTAIDAADISERVFSNVYPDYTLRTNHVFGATSEYLTDVVTETGQGSGDAGAALASLEAAGYELGGDGTLTLDGDQIGPFRLRATADPLRVTSMELIQSYLAEIGIEIIIETTDDLGGMLGEQDYDIAQFGWSGSPFFTGTVTQLWGTGSGNNFGNYSNAEVDELGALAQSSASLDEAAGYATEAAAIMTQDAYVLPLYDSPVYTFVTDAYANVRDNGAVSLRAAYNNHTWGLVAQ